jgi:hypothetical protein
VKLSLRVSKERLHLAAVLAAMLALFAACANADDNDDAPPPNGDDAGPSEAGLPEADAPDAGGDGGLDAAPLRCSAGTCLVDLPNAPVYGLTRFVFAGVYADPVSGVWAIANGVEGIDVASTAQLLHLEGDAWKVTLGVTLGADAQSVRLTSISGDGAGKIIAVGTTVADPTGVILRGDGTNFSVESFGEDLRATWVAAPNDAYVVGGDGGVFHSASDGGWAYEGTTSADFAAVWGSGPNDVYVGGSTHPDFQDNAYLGHRTTIDGGPSWTYTTFGYSEDNVAAAGMFAGVSGAPGSGFWAGAEFFGNTTVLAKLSVDGGQEVWTRDTFVPHVVLSAFWARTSDDVWAVGGLGRLYHYDGTTWADAFLVFNGAPLTANLTGVSGTSAGELFIVGDGVSLRRAPK